MATPIQYVPQFIPTDIGMMSNILQQRQAEYDMAYAAPGAFEDKFAQIQVSPENIAGKQAILGDFQGRIQKIVDRYGGDYGAASKDIVREISRERQNPFYQMAPQHAEAMKRQQSLMDKYGAFALPLQQVPSQFVTPEGQVMQDVNLTPTILNQQDLERALMTEFGGLGKQVREGGLQAVEGRPGMLQATTTRGIREGEVSGVVQQMMDRLYNMNPDLARAIDDGDPRAAQIAQNMAEQLVGGSTRQFMRDPSYTAKKGDDTTGYKNYIARVAPSTEAERSVLEIQKDLEKYSKASQDLSAYTEMWDQRIASGEKAPVGINLPAKQMAQQRNKALRPFEGAMLDDLTQNYGLSIDEAVQIVANEKMTKPVSHPVMVRPTADRSKDSMLNDLAINMRSLDLDKVDIHKDGKVKTRKKESKEKEMKEALYGGNIVDVEIDLKNGKILLHEKDGTSYGVPASSFGNKGIQEAMGNYNKIVGTVYGQSSNVVDPVAIGNNLFTAAKQFNPESGTYESVIYHIDPLNRTKTQVSEEQFNDLFFTEMFATYGTEAQYKPTNIN